MLGVASPCFSALKPSQATVGATLLPFGLPFFQVTLQLLLYRLKGDLYQPIVGLWVKIIDVIQNVLYELPSLLVGQFPKRVDQVGVEYERFFVFSHREKKTGSDSVVVTEAPLEGY